MTPQKATHEQVRRHNRQLLLRAVYDGLADSRAALAQATGLAKPTVSNLIAELITEGLLVEGGHGPSTESGGKRPRLIEFLPAAREVIGLSVDDGRVVAVLSDLSGRISARHTAELAGGSDPLHQLRGALDGLLAQRDAPLLCIGVGVPGAVDTQAGRVRHSALLGWQGFALAERLSECYEVPVYVGNRAELCALGQFAFGASGEGGPRRLVTILVSGGVELGVTLDHGAFHYGGDISLLPAPVDAAEPLGSLLSWPAVRARAEQLRRRHPDTILPAGAELSYMYIRYGAGHGDPAALALLEQLADSLAGVLTWVVGVLQPDEVSLAGPMADLGEGYLQEVSRRVAASLRAGGTPPPAWSLAYSDHLGAIGAVALALQKELAIL